MCLRSISIISLIGVVYSITHAYMDGGERSLAGLAGSLSPCFYYAVMDMALSCTYHKDAQFTGLPADFSLPTRQDS